MAIEMVHKLEGTNSCLCVGIVEAGWLVFLILDGGLRFLFIDTSRSYLIWRRSII